MRTVISDSQGVVTSQDGGGTRVENSLVTTGNVGVGADAGAGKAIGSLTLTSGGSGYTNGTYSQVALTGGSGTGATADIVVATNAVTVVNLRSPGQGYAVGDTLSCASIGAGSNFSVTVATTASIMRSDGTIVGSRIGVGTTTPRAALDVASGAMFATSTDRGLGLNAAGTFTDVLASRFVNLAPTLTAGGTTLTGADFVWVGANASAITATTTSQLYNGQLWADSSPAGVTHTLTGMTVQVVRNKAADLSTAGSVNAIQAFAQVSTGVGSASTANILGLSASSQNQVAGHTATALIGVRSSTSSTGNCTTAYAFYAPATAGAGTITTFYGLRIEATTAPTITNRWGISQEDTAANNVMAGRLAVGQAAGTAATALGDFGASTTARASLRLRSGTAPTSPNDGDIWYDGTNLMVRLAGVTRTVNVT